jgi:hypothetical protein
MMLYTGASLLILAEPLTRSGTPEVETTQPSQMPDDDRPANSEFE